jgi:hypothetical protein
MDIGMINWGFVNGKTQTDMPGDSWQRPYVLRPPVVWFHDLFHPNGTPYRAREISHHQGAQRRPQSLSAGGGVIIPRA